MPDHFYNENIFKYFLINYYLLSNTLLKFAVSEVCYLEQFAVHTQSELCDKKIYIHVLSSFSHLSVKIYNYCYHIQ